MSHVATVEIEIKDLDVLSAAAARCGLQLRRGQTTYHWWGRSVGDYPLPLGFKAEDLGSCEHALHIAGEPDVPPGEDGSLMQHAYEIGVCRRRDAQGNVLAGYTLLWDFMDSRLEKLVGGATANKLRQAYAAEAAIKQARQQGYGVREQRLQDGSLKLVLSK
jgi:hypothetical protein